MHQPRRRLRLRRLGAAAAGLALLAGGVVGALPDAQAAVSDAPGETWIANGDVNSVFQAGNRIYLGGSFDQIGPSTGSGVPLDPATGTRMAAFPEVNGPVYVAVPDGAGGWYIGGDFTRVGDRSRHNVARILADGSLGAWNPNTDRAVRAIVLAKGPGANIAWIGGDFTVINDASTPTAARGVAATNLYTGAAVWGLPGAGAGSVLALGLSADGSRLLAGGDFTTLGGVPRVRLASINPGSGAVDALFNPAPNGAVRAIAAASDGRLFVGGDFTFIAGEHQARLAALTPSGTADPAWQVDADGRVNALALSSDGARLFAGGDFGHVGGAGRSRLAMVTTAGGGAVESGWNPGAAVEVRAIALSTDGTRLYAGGGEDNGSPDMFGAPRRVLVAVDAATGGLVPGFDPRPSAATMALAASGGAVFAGGQFTSVNGVPRANLAALDATTGAADPGFVADTDGAVFAVTSDGVGLYAGGVFSSINGVTRRRLARVDAATGAVASGWEATASAKVQSLTLAGDRLYVGGTFSTIGGQPRSRIARVATANGAVDAWNPHADGGVHRIRLTADRQRVFVAGDFSMLGSVPRQKMAAIDATTGQPTAWHPKVQVPLVSMALSADATLAFVATRGGTAIGNRLQAWSVVTGELVWDRPGDGDFQAVDTSASYVYTGGHFTTVAGQMRGHLAAFDQQTGTITAWAPTISGVHGVLDMQVTAGSILVAGEFHKVSGAVAEGFARFASDDPPLGTATTTTTVGSTPTTGPGGTPSTTAPDGDTTTTTRPGDGASAASNRSGYWMVGAGGTVHAFGDARWLGNAPVPAGVAAVDLEPTPSGTGYWIVDGRGTVTSFGDAARHGSVSAASLAAGETVTSLSATPTGQGYWIFTTRGRVVPFGDAGSFGDMAATRLNGPVLDSIPTPSGRGYYMVASDGGIFAFGDARFFGSMGAARLNAPVQSLVPDRDGTGYWLVASDGGIFAFDAPFRGSMGNRKLNKPVTGMVRYGNGYLMVGEDGGIFNFSDLTFAGSLGANPPARPIVSVAAL